MRSLSSLHPVTHRAERQRPGVTAPGLGLLQRLHAAEVSRCSSPAQRLSSRGHYSRPSPLAASAHSPHSAPGSSARQPPEPRPHEPPFLRFDFCSLSLYLWGRKVPWAVVAAPFVPFAYSQLPAPTRETHASLPLSHWLPQFALLALTLFVGAFLGDFRDSCFEWLQARLEQEPSARRAKERLAQEEFQEQAIPTLTAVAFLPVLGFLWTRAPELKDASVKATVDYTAVDQGVFFFLLLWLFSILSTVLEFLVFEMEPTLDAEAGSRQSHEERERRAEANRIG